MITKMNKEFFEAVKMLESEKGISADYIYEKITDAIIAATKNSYGNKDNVVCEIDAEKQTMQVYVKIDVVEEEDLLDPSCEYTLAQALNYDPNAKVGTVLELHIDPKKFGRIVAQTAKSVIKQGIREAEKQLSAKEFQDRNQEVVTAVVQIVDEDTGDARIEIGKTFAKFFKKDQIPGETLTAGQLIKVYVASITEEKGVSYANITRTHPGLVKRLFEMEVPEIFDGTVEVMSVSREAGYRTKIAVNSHDENVDPVGACIGPRGARVAGIVDTLCGEKIDIVKYNEVPEKYIAAALAPAEVLAVDIEEGPGRSCHVVVPDTQLSLAIGNKGQNVRLAAKLTGWKIDIKALSAAAVKEEKPVDSANPFASINLADLTPDEEVKEEVKVEETATDAE